MGRQPLYRNVASGTTVDSQFNYAATEVDLRSEFDCFIFCGDGQIGHGAPYLIRRMRRDAELHPVYCECTKSKDTIEPDPDCSYCFGEGYLFDTEWLMGYTNFGGGLGGMFNKYTNMAPGNIRSDMRVFYFRYDSNIRYGDKLLTVALDTEGKPHQPLAIESIYKPHVIDEKRSDGGRLEFYTIYCREDDAIRKDTVK